MKVKELIELNAMITDLEITVRLNGNVLYDQLNIGPSEGVKPPYPTRVPREARYAGNLCRADENMFRDAVYIPKSINAWDDGKDYYQILTGRVPAKWLELEVYSWEVEEEQEPKTGHWIDCDNSDDYSADGYDCSVCGVNAEYATSYCPNCGCRMVEPHESEKV